MLEFIGPRPLIGYYLEFDLGMLDKYVRPLLGVAPAQPRAIEVSRLYYDWRAAQVPPGGNIDLRFETIRAAARSAASRRARRLQRCAADGHDVSATERRLAARGGKR